LWAEVRAIAAEVRTRVPDEVRLVADVNAAVSEDTRLLGLRGGRRYLYVGLPLLQAMNLAQFRSVLAHELGHYSHQHTRPEHRYVHRVCASLTITHNNDPSTRITRALIIACPPLWLVQLQ